jgi:integrase/recombinase XerD
MPSFQQFIHERQYLQNVSPRTLEWYATSFKWLPCEAPSQAQLNDAVVRMRQKGLKPTGCNSVGRAVNAYMKWAELPGRIRKLKEPSLVLPTFSGSEVKRLVKWKPQEKHDRRLHLLVLFLLDTGSRISEALGLRVQDIDLDNLLVTLDGKGQKQRTVPFSFELRKALYSHFKAAARTPESLLFATRTETLLSRNNVLRDVKALCRELGFEPPVRTVHAFRHSFALGYLRRGGSVFHLQKVLGHSSLEMTRRYANLSTVDLQAAHERVSLLAK